MRASQELRIVAAQLLEKARELEDLDGTGTQFSFRKAEIEVCQRLQERLGEILNRMDSTTALEWQKATGKRLVWQLWGRTKIDD